jgi:hypothetical protein
MKQHAAGSRTGVALQQFTVELFDKPSRPRLGAEKIPAHAPSRRRRWLALQIEYRHRAK